MLYFPSDVLCSDWTIDSLADLPEMEKDDDIMNFNVKWTFFSPE